MEKYNQRNIEYKLLIKDIAFALAAGGVGSILSCVKMGKKVIAVPRLQKYQEHVNDHQVQLVEKFQKEGYIIGVQDVNQLKKAIQKIPEFEPKPYQKQSKGYDKN